MGRLRRTKTTRKNHRAGLYRELESRGFVHHGGADPKGGVHLRPVKPDMVDAYLGDDRRAPGTDPRRDPRSYPFTDRRGRTIGPTLSYWTFVNFSQSYNKPHPEAANG